MLKLMELKLDEFLSEIKLTGTFLKQKSEILQVFIDAVI